MFIYNYRKTYIYIYMCVYIYMHIIHIYIHICIYIYTQIHICIYSLVKTMLGLGCHPRAPDIDVIFGPLGSRCRCMPMLTAMFTFMATLAATVT